MKARFQIFFILTALWGCIGTDYLEDPIVGARIEVFPTHVALMPSQSMQLTATYYNIFGLEEAVEVSWTLAFRV